MEERAVRGVSWTMLDYAANKALTLATTLILARLLAPADFGALALATLVTSGMSLLSELGLGNTLVLRQELSHREQGTLLSLMTALGVVLAALTALLAPVAAGLLGDPRVGEILPVLALSVALIGPTSFYDKLMQRELCFRQRLMSRIAQNGSYAVVAIALAALGAGVWSLAIGLTAGLVVYALALFTLAPYRVRPAADLAVARDAFSTGRGFLMQGGLGFLQDNVDYLTIGPLLGTRRLGLYTMAYRLGELPYLAISDPVARVTFPTFARMRARGEDIRRSFLSVLRLVALVTVPMGLLLSACAEPFTHAILGQKWAPMAGVLTVLGLWAALRPLQNTMSWLLNSMGLQLLLGRNSMALLVPAVPAMILAAKFGGIVAVACVVLVRTLAGMVLPVAIATRRASLSLRSLCTALRPAAQAAPGTWLAAWICAQATGGALPAGLSLALSAAAGLLVYGSAVWLSDSGAVRDGARQVARAAGRRPSMGAA
jgi:O-antigen/teichoic acid export membrane protein